MKIKCEKLAVGKESEEKSQIFASLMSSNDAEL